VEENVKKTVLLCLTFALLVSACARRPTGSDATLRELRKTRPWIAATTKLVSTSEGQSLSDSVDYPFVNDPAVLGSWQAVDFVTKKADFKPDKPSWSGELWLRSLTFKDGGVLDAGFPRENVGMKWTRGHVLSTVAGAGSDASYEIVPMAGRQFMLFQWKSGDYHLRYDEPAYYVLEKGTAQSVARTADAPVQEMKIDYATTLSKPGTLEIVRRPPAASFGRGALASLPAYDSSSTAGWQVDVRGSDLSKLDLRSRLKDLLHADFDSVTKWPQKLPRGFDPSRIMEIGKDPGLGIRLLHAQGHTGKGVGIAIIDQALLVDHVEYRDRLRLYEEIHWPASQDPGASMHAPAVASIAAGKTVGVAPEADLYFIANWMGITTTSGEFRYELSSMAASIDRIVAVNRTLPQDRRIRVVSISLGINPAMTGYDLASRSIEKARAEGIYVAFVGSNPFLGLGREPTKDPNDFASYGPGDFWKTSPTAARGNLLVPMDSRCTASPTGADDFVLYPQGGMSWAVPWVAGLYALACQERPAVTPETFWAAAAKTARTTPVGTIIDPAKLLEEIAKGD
jgi:hypothetical protein